MAIKPPSRSKPATIPSVKGKPGKPPVKPAGSPGAKRTAKTFRVEDWSDASGGDKIVVYGRSGIGKTTLAAMAPNAVFIGIDDGGRKITHPITGDPLRRVPGIETFQDIRDALAQDGVFPAGSTLVIDTLSKAEELIQQHVLENVTINGQRASNFRKFGWDGDRHTLDFGRLLLTDLERLAAQGHNVVLLCQQGQIKVANAEGADYLEDGPFLQHRNDCSFREEVKQWADHVLRLGYLDLEVAVERGAKAGKVVSQDATRAIFSGGAQHFTAKSRPVNGYRIPPVISFESEADDSLWQYMFQGVREEVPDPA